MYARRSRSSSSERDHSLIVQDALSKSFEYLSDEKGIYIWGGGLVLQKSINFVNGDDDVSYGAHTPDDQGYVH